jgi:hypothetical protein
VTAVTCGAKGHLARTLRLDKECQGAKVKPKKPAAEKESSSAFFEKLRPKFLDWEPPTEEEKALELNARRAAKEAELKRVTDLAKERDSEKVAARKR